MRDISTIVVLLLIIPVLLGAVPGDKATEEQRDLKSILEINDSGKVPESKGLLEQYLKSDSWAVRATSLAVLYQNDPDKYRESVFEVFAIHTKSANIPTQENATDYLHALDVVSEKCKTGYGQLDFRLVPLSVFEHFREENKWFLTEKYGWLSCEAFFRTMFLVQLWGGDPRETEALVHQIDQHNGNINSWRPDD